MLLGVSVRFLKEFARWHRIDAGASSLSVGELVLGVTSVTRLSVCEQMRWAVTEDAMPAVGRAAHFVSHAHACSFVKLCDALGAYVAMHALDEASTYLWVDLFSIRQHDLEADIVQVAPVEQAIGSVVLVLDPWDRPVSLTRIWCLFELLQSLHDGVSLELTLAPDEQRRLVAELQRDYTGVLRLLTAFDVRTADVSVEADRALILQMIASTFGEGEGSVDYFNRETRAALRRALSAFSQWSA